MVISILHSDMEKNEMTGRLFLKITGISLAIVLTLAILFLWTFDFGVLKPKLESTLSDVIDREFRINGDFSLKLLPTPTLLFEDLTLANPSWGSEPEMLTAGKGYMEIKLMPLFSERIEVEKLQLENIRLLVESSADDKSNWEFDLAQNNDAEPEQKTEADKAAFSYDIQTADMSNIVVIYRQPDAEDVSLRVESFTVNQRDSATTEINGTGRFIDIPLSVSGQVSEHHTDLRAQAGEVKLVSKYDYPEDTVNFSSSLSTLSDLGGLLKIEELPDTELSLEGHVSMSKGNVMLKRVVASTKGIRIALDGEIDTGTSRVELSARASGDKLSLLSPDLPPLPFEIQSEFMLAGNKVDMPSYRVQIGSSTLTGKAHIENNERPVIHLQAKSDLIDLTPFINHQPASKPKAEKTEAKSNAETHYIFDETPLPFDTLQALNLDTDLSITRLIVQDAEFKNVTIQAQAKNGKMTVSNAFEGKLSGKYDNKLTLNTSDKKADIRIDTKVRDLKLALLSGASVPEEQIPVSNMNIDLHSSGDSPRALASNLDGNVVANQGKGKVSNALIEKFTGDILTQLFNAINPFAEKEEFTQWECSLFAIEFESGEGDIEGFLMQSEQLMVVGGGNIDLNQETLAIEFNTKPREGVGVSADMFVTPFVKLSGTLAQPSVGLNNKGVLLSGGAAVLTGGMSFLYKGLMDRVTAEAGRCEEAETALKDRQNSAEPDQ